MRRRCRAPDAPDRKGRAAKGVAAAGVKGDGPNVDKTFFLPRGGAPQPVTVKDRESLRLLRTELELLRRIARRTSRAAAGSAEPRISQWERDELAAILADATHPIVEEMTALIDAEFADLRQEILMAAVNEQAENIVQDIVHAGLVAPGAASSPPVATDDPMPNALDVAVADPPGAPVTTDAVAADDAAGVEAALAVAEAELAKLVGTDDSVPPGDDALDHAAPEPMAFAVEADAPATDGAAPTPVEEAAAESATDADATFAADAADVAGLKTASAEAPPSASAADDVDDQIAAALAASQPGVLEVVETNMNEFASTAEPVVDDGVITRGTSFEEFSPQRAEQAVAEIERGVRKLADILSGEVSDQWKQARVAFDEIMAKRGELFTACAKAEALAQQLDRLKIEAEIARDEADIARREAKLARDDAKLAQQRAEQIAGKAARPSK